MTDYKKLCAELLAALKIQLDELAANNRLCKKAEAALAEGPTDEDILQVAANTIEPYKNWGIAVGQYESETKCAVEAYGSELVAYARAVLARWGRPAIDPVPVSERLPGPEDVNDDGEVWVEEPAYDYPLADTGDYDTEPGGWVLRPLSSFDKRNNRRWLPYHALPLPTK
jgi:hypothetical protein